MRNLGILLLWVGSLVAATAAVPVPLKLGADSSETLNPPSVGAPLALPPVRRTATPSSLFDQPPPPGTDATFLLKARPRQCPSDYAWCQRQYASPLAEVQANVGAGVGVNVDGLRVEYAQGSHFNYLGVRSKFSP
ncbi:MAG TPA: hypothetical protein VFN52_03205 [Acidiferrobacteraceae bacterium]|nr:hypothetical protein [Acidiferrobacteraceae bacterium]